MRLTTDINFKDWDIGPDGFACTRTWLGYLDAGCSVYEIGEPGMSGLTLWNGDTAKYWSIGKSKGRLT